MDVQIKVGAVDVTNKVTSYTRDQNICTGIGTLSIQGIEALEDSVDIWDTVTLFEGGTKKGTYFVTMVEEGATKGTSLVECQDGSKKLQDYFISDLYEVNGNTDSYYWINKFASDATISSISYVSGTNTTPLNPDAQLGMMSAYEAIVNLIQQNGWVMYMNANNTLVIGRKDVAFGSSINVNEGDILKIDTAKNDKMLRNRAIVWGAASTFDGSWVIAEASTMTPWNYGPGDQRTIVFANSNIKSYSYADELARLILQEFARIEYTKTIDLEGARSINLGGAVRVNSRAFSGTGIVTTISSSASANKGLVTTVILDERCPRLFAAWELIDEYVYVGTSGKGVYQKLIGDSTWNEFNTGLDYATYPQRGYIADMYINNDIFAITTAEGTAWYKNGVSAPWTQLIPSGMVYRNETHSPESLFARSVAINSDTNDIYVGFNAWVASGELWDRVVYKRSWVQQFSPYNGEVTDYIQMHDGNNDHNYMVLDIDTTDEKVLATLANKVGWETISGYYGGFNNLGYGVRGPAQYLINDTPQFNVINDVWYWPGTLFSRIDRDDIKSVYLDGETLWVCFENDYASSGLVEIDVPSGNYTVHYFGDEFDKEGSLKSSWVIEKRDSATFYVVQFWAEATGVGDIYEKKLYRYIYDHTEDTAIDIVVHDFGEESAQGNLGITIQNGLCLYIYRQASNTLYARMYDIETFSQTQYYEEPDVSIWGGVNSAYGAYVHAVGNNTLDDSNEDAQIPTLEVLIANAVTGNLTYSHNEFPTIAKPAGYDDMIVGVNWLKTFCVSKYSTTIGGVFTQHGFVKRGGSWYDYTWAYTYDISESGFSYELVFEGEDELMTADEKKRWSNAYGYHLATDFKYAGGTKRMVGGNSFPTFVADCDYVEMNDQTYWKWESVTDSDYILGWSTSTETVRIIMVDVYGNETIYTTPASKSYFWRPYIIGNICFLEYTNKFGYLIFRGEDYDSGFENTYKIIETDFKMLKEIGETQWPARVECSQNSPAVVYHAGEGVAYPHYIYTPVITEQGSGWMAEYKDPGYKQAELRTMTIVSPDNFPVDSGEVTGYKYCIFAERDNSKVIMYDLDAEVYEEILVDTLTGDLKEIETTNYNNPYVFVSASGNPIDILYERTANRAPVIAGDPVVSEFTGYSLTDASGYSITVIRTDDRM